MLTNTMLELRHVCDDALNELAIEKQFANVFKTLSLRTDLLKEGMFVLDVAQSVDQAIQTVRLDLWPIFHLVKLVCYSRNRTSTSMN